MQKKKKVVVAVSGGFDPVHIGHVRLFREAKKLGDILVVILNNDNWLIKKKGYNFMSEKDRKEIIENIKHVDKVIVSSHPKNPKDMSIVKELAKIRPHIFANGGDRTKENANIKTSSLNPEQDLARRIGIEMVFNVGKGGKIRSSSELVKALKDKRKT
jgi:D-beta-D-heptose 7-phosphate kinase/D-beta-D-heptose 1-phosphate adenosyltransferase